MKQVFVLLQFVCIGLLAFTSDFFAIDVVLLVQLAAILIGVWAIRSVGENNWSVYPVPNPASKITRIGPYKTVRHPMYTSLLLFFLPVIIRSNDWFSWTIYGVLALTLVFKIGYEEKQILSKHPEYEDFKKLTKKRVIPFVW